MKIKNEINFDMVDDPICTEKLINFQLQNIQLDYPYIDLPIAYSLNKLGLFKTQEIINEIEKINKQKKIYVCQHILVNRLNFHNNFVFTPHTEKFDSYNFIPHYNPIHNKKPIIKKISERKILMSFIGDFSSHPTRGELIKLNNDSNIIVKPTRNWFFYKSKEEQNGLKKIYVETLENSKLSLCPRGTGPSTLRLFESMSVGSVPIIFNDLKLPKDLDELVYKFKISDIIKKDFLLEFQDYDIQERSEKIYNLYWEKYSNDNLYKSIINNL